MFGACDHLFPYLGKSLSDLAVQGTLNNHKNFMIKKYIHLSRIFRKPALCICENKGTDQLRGNSAADQCLCFRYKDNSTPLHSESEISSL